LKALESQLQEAKQQAEIVQVQLKPLSAVERMKRSQEQCTAQQQVHTIQRKVMEVTQRLQPIQDEACQLFAEIEGRGEELEQVITAAEQRLEGPVNEAVIQEFIEQEAWRNNKSKQLEPSSRLLKQSYPDQSDSG
jgi:phage shock protein A